MEITTISRICKKRRSFETMIYNVALQRGGGERQRQRDSQEEPPGWRERRNNAQVEWVLLIRVGVAASNTANEHYSRPPHLPRHETTTGARVVLNHNNLPYLMRN